MYVSENEKHLFLFWIALFKNNLHLLLKIAEYTPFPFETSLNFPYL